MLYTRLVAGKLCLNGFADTDDGTIVNVVPLTDVDGTLNVTLSQRTD